MVQKPVIKIGFATPEVLFLKKKKYAFGSVSVAHEKASVRCPWHVLCNS